MNKQHSKRTSCMAVTATQHLIETAIVDSMLVGDRVAGMQIEHDR
jgi:hypothetical protein